MGTAQAAETPKQDSKPADTGPGNDTADDNGETALMRAVKAGRMESVQKLIESGSNVNYAVPKMGVTALMYAVNNGDTALVKLLLEKGANVNAQLVRKMDGYRPVHSLYIQDNNRQSGVMKGWEGDFARWTPLFFAVANGDAEMIQILLDAGADINYALEDGETMLMYATREGKADTVRLLKEKGANINAAKSKGLTAFAIATEAGNRELVDFFLESGAKFDADRTFEISLAHYLDAPEYWFGMMKRMLASGADANAVAQSYTLSVDRIECMAPGMPLLTAAVACGFPDVAQLLIDAKADVHATVELSDLFHKLNAMNIAVERKGALQETDNKAKNTQRVQTAKRLVQMLEAAGAHE